jgi:hypothetical protein
MTITAKDLQPGDVLLYGPSSLFGWLIVLKTWEKISHVEVYAGNGFSWAARDGQGVGRYPLRLEHLRVVRRPTTFNYIEAEDYFRTVDGQAYDWVGLGVFLNLRQHGSKFKQWCSEFADNLSLAGGTDCFGDYPPDHLSPADFLKTPLLRTIWPEKRSE